MAFEGHREAMGGLGALCWAFEGLQERSRGRMGVREAISGVREARGKTTSCFTSLVWHDGLFDITVELTFSSQSVVLATPNKQHIQTQQSTNARRKKKKK